MCNCLATVFFIILWINTGTRLKFINQDCYFGNFSLELQVSYCKYSSANYVWWNAVKI